MKKILIADDNKELLISLTSILAKIDNTKIINISSNGADAYNNIISLKPDIIILDLDMPKMTGIEILKNINAISDYYPKIIINSGYPELINKIKNEKNIQMFLNKGQSLNKIIDFICECISNEENHNNSIKLLLEQLNILHFNIGTKGCKYIIEAVLMIKENPDLLDNMENGVFKILAAKNKTNVKKVKWNITRCINSMCKYSSKRDICVYFKLTDYIKPTPKFVLAYLSRVV